MRCRSLKTFVTLSPIPGLARWMRGEGLQAATAPRRCAPLAAHYLLTAKRPEWHAAGPGGAVSSGERRIGIQTCMPGPTPRPAGCAQSGGVMVNYLYDLARVTENHEAFAARGAGRRRARDFQTGRSARARRTPEDRPMPNPLYRHLVRTPCRTGHTVPASAGWQRR